MPLISKTKNARLDVFVINKISVKLNNLFSNPANIQNLNIQTILNELSTEVMAEIEQRIYKFPTSQVKYRGKKSSYYEIISSLAFEECNNALVRITERVDLNKINKLIDTIEGISDVRREFYKTILKERFEKILLESYIKLTEED